MTVLGANFTVRLKGTGYKEIEPLAHSIVSSHTLGNFVVQLVAIEANNGKFLTNLI